MPRDVRELGIIHRRSSRHRAEIERSARCGCFYCLSIFAPWEIMDWVDGEDKDSGVTALCPRCGIDAVLPELPSLNIDMNILLEMERHFFGMLTDTQREAASLATPLKLDPDLRLTVLRALAEYGPTGVSQKALSSSVDAVARLRLTPDEASEVVRALSVAGQIEVDEGTVRISPAGAALLGLVDQ
jgi:hypothetical protein